MNAGPEWIEVRANDPAILESASWPKEKPTTEAPVHEGVLSVVVRPPNGETRARRLPSLYLGTAAIFADRELARVHQELSKCVDAITLSTSRPTYFIDPCEIGGRRGLYARDVHSRSAYRRRLMRQGMRFGDDRFPRFNDDGRFECDDWGEFDPSFVLMDLEPDDPQEIGTMSAGLMAFLLATHRFGRPSSEELSLLIAFCKRAEAVSASDPSTVAGHLDPRPQ